MKKTNLFCPIYNGECKEDKCAMFLGGMCSFKLAADRLVHIAIDTNDIAETLEERLEEPPVLYMCPLDPDGAREDCDGCSCYDEDNGCCRFAGQKGLIEKLYDNAMKGLFKDSAIKEE